MKKVLAALLACLTVLTASATVIYADETTERIPCPNGECAIYRFKDIPGWEDWGSHDALEFVLFHGYMDGTGEDTFSPDLTLTRAQFLTILYRVLEQPEAPEATQFTDLTQDWYKKAIGWAVSRGIVNGTSDTTFSPDATINQEQIATMLYRCANDGGVLERQREEFARFQQDEIHGDPNINYADVNEAPEYARNPLKWCHIIVCTEQLDGGSVVKLLPKYTPTRYEAAGIFCRFHTVYYNVVG